MWIVASTAFMCVLALQVKGDNCPYDGDLTAKSKTSITIFNQSLPAPYFSRRPMECIWEIKASDAKKHVRLEFGSFHIIERSSFGDGDCVAIYDEDDSDIGLSSRIEEICRGVPLETYNSTGRYLTVVFRQGSNGGQRWFSMKYSMFTPDSAEENHFWSTTFGRILSFLIVIAIFSVFSFIFKAWRQGTVSDICGDCCDCLGRGVRRVVGLGARCTSLFKSRTRAGETTTGPEPPGELRISRSELRSGEADDAETDIVTISGSHGSTPAPDLSTVFSSRGSNHSSSSGRNMGDPPPDYSTVLAHSASSSVSSEGSESVRDGGDVVPDYDSAVSPPFPSDLHDSSYNSVLSPPPDDGSAPPSYELPAPPSYDSLFNSSNA